MITKVNLDVMAETKEEKEIEQQIKMYLNIEQELKILNQLLELIE